VRAGIFKYRQTWRACQLLQPESIASLGRRCEFSVAAIRTRGVRFCEKGDCAAPLYRIAKLAGELLNVVAALLNKGHDMAVYLKRN